MNIKIKIASFIIASSLSAVQASERNINNEGFSTLNAIPVSSMTDIQMDTVEGKGVLSRFRLANPGLYRPSINGQTVFSNAVKPYGSSLSFGSLYARYQQRNAYQLINAITYSRYTYGVNPYLSFFGRRLF